jgi:CBS domain-containing protein
MNARDVMTRPVVSVRPEASIQEVARLMLQHKVSGLPVVDASGVLVGVITEGDFLRRVEIGAQRRRPHWIEFFTSPGRLAEEYVHASGRKVEDVMSTDVSTVTEESTLAEIAHLMEGKRIKRVPVVRGNELTGYQLVGIVTRADLVRAIMALQKDALHPSNDDLAIRERLFAELKRQPWAVPLSMIDLTVKNGAVELGGVVRDERQRQALRVAAENVPGVKSVSDQSVRIEPVIGLFADQAGN